MKLSVPALYKTAAAFICTTLVLGYLMVLATNPGPLLALTAAVVITYLFFASQERK